MDTFESHDDVRCFSCRKVLKTIHGEVNGMDKRYQKACFDCGVVTEYKLVFDPTLFD